MARWQTGTVTGPIPGMIPAPGTEIAGTEVGTETVATGTVEIGIAGTGAATGAGTRIANGSVSMMTAGMLSV